MLLQQLIDLNSCGEMGWRQANGILKPYIVPGNYYTRPSPYTPHTTSLDCTKALPPLAYAYWRVCWTAASGTATIRLYACSPDNSAPAVTLAYISTNDMHNPGLANVSNDATNLMTTHGPNATIGESGSVNVSLPALIAQGKFQTIGWDLAGDNTNPVTIFTSRLELGWTIPDAAQAPSSSPASQPQAAQTSGAQAQPATTKDKTKS